MTLTLDLHLPRHRGGAEFCPNHCHRYKLWRHWNDDLPSMGIVGHNPSIAGAHRNDRTVTRLIDFATTFGYGGFDLYNLSAGVSTDPTLLATMPDPIGPDNDDHLHRLGHEHDFILLAWGGDADPERARTVASRLWRAQRQRGGTLATLGWTAGNQPRHPVRLARNTPLHPLTAAPNQDYSGIDTRWTDLIADTTDLDDLPAPSSRTACHAR